jgi:ribose transport system ATP-binding protein
MATAAHRPDAGEGAPVLELHGVSKRFPGVLALADVGFDLQRGEVHVLVGENGAGKSTLVKILSGIYQPDAGEIRFDGRPVTLRDPHAAQRLGISTVHQELNLVPHLDVGRNVFLGREPTRGPGGLVDYPALYAATGAQLAVLGVELDPRTPVRRLGLALQQMVEIAKALVAEARVLILDEPTAAITSDEAERLFTVVDGLRARGAAVVFISHHLDDATRIGDRATVLRDGRHVATLPMAGTTPRDLIRLMVGRDLTQQYPKQPSVPGPVALEVSGLSRRGVLHDVSFGVRRGEVLGIAGLVGAGRSELARAVFGIDPIDAGRIAVNGKPVRIDGPRDAIRHGLALLPEDRKLQGLVLPLTIADNVALAAPDKLRAPVGLVPPRSRLRAARRFVDALRIRTPSARQRVVNLSGGNQQKVVLAKWLLTEADVFIFDEPTRGIDVGAKVDVYRLMNELLAKGAAIVMISSELPEVLGMSDRIAVMRGGRIVAELAREEATQEAIMTHAAAPVARSEADETGAATAAAGVRA